MPLSSSTDASQLAWSFVDFDGDRTLLLGDSFKWLNSIDDGGNQTVTVPPLSVVNFILGVQLAFEQVGTSTITFAPGAGVTLNSRGGLLVSNGPNAVISLVLKDADNDIWTLFGDLA